MHCVFLDLQTFEQHIDLEAITQHVSKFTSYQTTNQSQITDRCKDADIVITNKVVFNREILTELPNLKLICVAATGINNIDLEAAKSLGIKVTNVKNYSNKSVAQYVFAQLLSYYSRIEQHNSNVKKGLWQTQPVFCLHDVGSDELAGKTLGIVGYGNLGRSVEKIAQAFDMKVIVSERRGATSIRDGRVSFEQMMATADIISLHCPLTEETKHLINANTLSNAKRNLVIINTARGDIIDDSALLDALTNNRIEAAILDVLNQEPPPANHPLLNTQLDNLIVTAHIAWGSSQSQQRLLNLLSDHIKAIVNNQKIDCLTEQL